MDSDILCHTVVDEQCTNCRQQVGVVGDGCYVATPVRVARASCKLAECCGLCCCQLSKLYEQKLLRNIAYGLKSCFLSVESYENVMVETSLCFEFLLSTNLCCFRIQI